MRVPRLDQRTGRVNRGGSWISYPEYARVANRDGNTPGARNSLLGFRLAF